MKPAVCPPLPLPLTCDALHACLALSLLVPLLVAVPALPPRRRAVCTATSTAVAAAAVAAALLPPAAAAAAISAALYALRFPHAARTALPVAAAASAVAAVVGCAEGALGAREFAVLFGADAAVVLACAATWAAGWSGDGSGKGCEETGEWRARGDARPAPPTARDCSALSLAYFGWLTPLVRAGRARVLELRDLPPLAARMRCAVVTPLLRVQWKGELRRSAASPSLARALGNTFGARLALGGLLKVGSDVLLLLRPTLLQRIVVHLQNTGKYSAGGGDLEKGLLFALSMLSVCIAESIFYNNYYALMNVVETKINSALVALIFEKSCRLSSCSLAAFSHGFVHNCMAVDAKLVSDSFGYVHHCWSGVLQILMSLYLLKQLLGTMPMAAGVCVALCVCPLQVFVIRRLKKERAAACSRTDERVGIVGEALAGIGVIKYMAWERAFLRRIQNTRLAELSHVRRALLLGAVNLGISVAMPVMLSLVSFSTFVLFGGTMDASILFPAISLFFILKSQFLKVPAVFVLLVRSATALDRCRRFLMAADLPRPQLDSDEFDLDNCDVVATGANIAWGQHVVLSGVDLRLPAGSLTCVVGNVAAGKSTLLAGILGEAQAVSGMIGVHPGRSVAYMPQKTFIRNASLRNNVLFGLEMDEMRYREALRVSGLLPDLLVLPDGDLTEIGGKGVNLSGGQRARCTLARAVYSDSDIVLLDTPLAAVDTQVARYIWERCVTGCLNSRTRIVTTNNLEFAASPPVDFIVFIEDGVVAEFGRRDKLLSNPQSCFSRSLQSEIPSRSGMDEQCEAAARLELCMNENGIQPIQQTKNNACLLRPRPPCQLEKGCSHRTRSGDYMAYLGAAGGSLTLLLVFVLFMAERAANFGSDLFLSGWSENGSVQDNSASHLLNAGLLNFASISVLAAILPLLANMGTVVMSLRASVVMHENLCLRIFGSPSWWFDSTPVGRVLNRFHSCIDKIDNSLALSLQRVTRLSLRLFTLLGFILYADAMLVGPVVSAALLYLFMEQYYRDSSIDLHRLESTTKSPLYSHFGEVLDGVMSVRAFNAVPRFRDESYMLTDYYISASYLHTSLTRWLALRLELLGAVLVSSAVVTSLFVVRAGRASPELCSMSLSYCLQLVSSLYWTVRRVADVSSHFSAVAELSEYSDAPPHPQEQDLSEKATKLNVGKSGLGTTWATVRDLTTPEFSLFVNNSQFSPSAATATAWIPRGEIEFRSVCMRYRPDLDLVLRQVSFKIKPGTTLGICGRTGAGKTSLVSALFRLQELDAGQILIDGTDITKIPVEDLRSSLGAIAQSPTLFSGTIQSNLDMPGTSRRSSVARALNLSGLCDTTALGCAAMTIDTVVAEGGASLSAGQRQLLCLGRVLLRGPKICVLDEATSSVDGQTDARMAATITSELKGRTLLIVAHRLNSIMHCNQVLVMDDGAVAEFGAPSQLLENPSSALSQLVDESGPDSARQLREMACVSKQKASSSETQVTDDLTPF